MSKKLKDYQVLDVFCGGTFYKVRHKVTDNIFAWKAYNCSAHSDEQIQNVVDDVRTISEAASDVLLRYHDTVLHAPTRTLYLVVEYLPWRSLGELQAQGGRGRGRLAEGFLWRVLVQLARAARAAAALCPRPRALAPRLAPASVLVGPRAELRVNCFEWTHEPAPDLMRQAGALLLALTEPRPGALPYSDDLRDIVTFLAEERSAPLPPDAVLYHPTVLTNLETFPDPTCIADILISSECSVLASEVNKCDSEKAGDLCGAIRPLPRTKFNVGASPIYSNVSPKRKLISDTVDCSSSRDPLSPTVAALALELPGFVPRSRRPYSDALQVYGRPQLVSEQTFSAEWLARLAALRRREEALNQRERDLIAKEIVNSPSVQVIPLDDSKDLLDIDSNGITLPPVTAQGERKPRASRRRRVRSRPRRQSCGYEDLDSSLSADTGDNSVVITATKFTKDNMPRRNIFPEVSTKKVHFTAANPFVESDESVTLTFYELDSVDKDGYQVPKLIKGQKDINQFKYLDLEKMTREKRSAMNWSHSSPSKQAKLTRNVLCDISNQSSIRKTPSKTSLSSNSSRMSMMSAKSHWSVESSISKVSEGSAAGCEQPRLRQAFPQTPVAPPDAKKKTRKSLIPFKTPFKFMSSAKS